MRPDEFFFPHIFTYESQTFYGNKVNSKNEILITLIDETCPFDIGKLITLQQGTKERHFEILDYDVNQSLDIDGGGYPYLASLKVRALDVKPTPQPNVTSITFNGAVHARGDFQAGSINSITKNITIEQLAKAIEESNDPEVKSLWSKLTNNASFAAIAAGVAQSLLG
ncbi:TPA: hypothetical protein I8438_001803 [Serratia marcescens]|uniref:Uncharacterized protein n=1 Tax=Serratia marcescens TaxID=615 RepID=A0AB33FSA4_SERMA|nr:MULTISPECIES: hypothetical protein [Serratia]AKL42410.1 hypothetical protein AB188_18430 [Serratia marcescens]AWL69717.1 hypothetical protein DKC05_19705 [Serratia marcescens]UBI62652.1 hypothetical protein GF111_17510 [Serratia sp. HRI]HAT2209826.1 hypothetical protein [Serratia marcescens]HAT2221087.1 hypothetical protein [Serratia marcescens]